MNQPDHHECPSQMYSNNCCRALLKFKYLPIRFGFSHRTIPERGSGLPNIGVNNTPAMGNWEGSSNNKIQLFYLCQSRNEVGNVQLAAYVTHQVAPS